MQVSEFKQDDYGYITLKVIKNQLGTMTFYIKRTYYGAITNPFGGPMSHKNTHYFNHFLILITLGCLLNPLNAANKRQFKKDILKETFHFDKNTKASVSLNDLKQGCPKRDCIPSIDKPKFVNLQKVDFMAADEVVITTSYQGQTKIYSRNILESHEIVNDWFGSLPVAVTFCPLCGSAVAIVRIIDGNVTEFGVSGVLHNSDLVMYDRKSNTLWGQLDARAIMGTHTGKKLRKISAQMMTWQQAKESYPKALVLSKNTGFPFEYNKVSYQKYYDSDRVVFPVSSFDARANKKAIVYGFKIGKFDVAFTQQYLQKNPEFEQNIGMHKIKVKRSTAGHVEIIDKSTGESLVVTHAYWFAWYNFHPKTLLFGGKNPS